MTLKKGMGRFMLLKPWIDIIHNFRNNLHMPLDSLKRKLFFGHTAILLIGQWGLTLFYVFFGLNLDQGQTHAVLIYLLWAVPLIGGIFSIYIPMRLFRPEIAYPKKVAISNAAGVLLIYGIAMLHLRANYNYPAVEIAKLSLIALSVGILQCSTTFLFTIKTLYPHIEASPTRRVRLYHKNLLLNISFAIAATIVVGIVAFNELEKALISYHEPIVWSSYAGDALFNILIAFLLTIAIITALSFLFTHLINLPLRELASSAQAVINGQVKKVRAISEDEVDPPVQELRRVDDLGDAFNMMVEKVIQRESEMITRGQQITFLYNLAEALNQNKTTTELFKLTIQWFDMVFGLDVGALRLLSGDSLILVASAGIEREALEEIRSVKVGESISGLALQKNDIVVLEDILSISEPYTATAKKLGLQCAVCIPLRAGENVVGTLTVGSSRKTDIYQNASDMLNSVSNLLGVAIERSWHFDRIEKERFEWETAVTFIKDLISIHDNQWKIKKVNPAFLEYFGFKDSEDVLGKCCYEVFHKMDMPPSECPQLEAVMTRNKAYSLIEGPDGRVVSVTVYPIFKEDGVIEGSIHITRDVTELTRLKEQLHQADKLSALGRLAAGIAHNVNNPLTYSLNYLFILKETTADKKAKELVAKAEEGIIRSRDVLEKLLDFSMPSEGPMEVVDVGEAVTTTLTFLSAEIAKRGIHIHTELAEKIWVKATKKSLEEVFLNLITNAIDAGTTEIIIDSHRGSRDAGITITDNGCGIDKEHLPRIFEPYFSTKPKDKGTGLGLYVSYNIIKSFGGSLFCTSKKGVGSQFFILLPAID